MEYLYCVGGDEQTQADDVRVDVISVDDLIRMTEK